MVGIIFTKINLDTFDKSQKALLKDFETVLKAGAISYSLNYKLICSPLFLVQQALEKEGSEKEVLLSYALLFIFSFLQTLLNLMKKELKTLKEAVEMTINPRSEIFPSIWLWLPMVRITVKWLKDNINIWSYIFQSTRLNVDGPVTNKVRSFFWKDFSEFATGFNNAINGGVVANPEATWEEIANQEQQQQEEKREQMETETERTVFWEDIYLEGFSPLKDNVRSEGMTNQELEQFVNREKAREIDLIFAQNIDRAKQILADTIHITDIQHYEFLHHKREMVDNKLREVFSYSVMKYDEPIHKPEPIEASDEEVEASGGEDENVLRTNSNILALLENLKEEDPGISELKEKQQQLQEKIKQEVQTNQELFVRESAKILELLPNYTTIVPDTNCLISSLPLVQGILGTGTFTVVIPLVVINELEGLKKGPERVRHDAGSALEFLESQFASKNLHLKAQTQKGNYLTNIAFRTEEGTNGKHTNDDIILECCLFQTKKPPNQKASPVVLLTDDRNLKVKALAAGVPVADSFDFEKALTKLVQQLNL